MQKQSMQPWYTRTFAGGARGSDLLKTYEPKLGEIKSDALRVFQPRQFEYHPALEGMILFGTLKGEAVAVNMLSNQLVHYFSSGLSVNKDDPLLGLCWYRRHHNLFVTGSSTGVIRSCSIGGNLSSNDGLASPERKRSSRLNILGTLGVSLATDNQKIVEFDLFEKLTSVHINCDDTMLLASGYSHDVRLSDLCTQQTISDLKGIHADHINISRFSNHSPYLFATSSFDRTVKMWDSRIATHSIWTQTDSDKGESSPTKPRPLYSCNSRKGHVMVCFSPDDTYLLASAVDNEITQFLALDGRCHLKLEMPEHGLEDNFTRAYYTASGAKILSGSSEEQVVRLHCALTGQLVEEAEMYPGRRHPSLYIQSLRGDPFQENKFSVLVNYRDPTYPLEIVTIDMDRDPNGQKLPAKFGQGHGLHSSTLLKKALYQSLHVGPQASWAQLIDSNFSGQCSQITKDGSTLNPDTTVRCFEVHTALVQDQCSMPSVEAKVCFLAHAAILAARCSVLKDLLQASSEGLSLSTDAEAGPQKYKVDLPKQISGQSFVAVLDYLYTDSLVFEEDMLFIKKRGKTTLVPECLTDLSKSMMRLDWAEGVAHAALALKLPHLFSLAVADMAKIVSVDTITSILDISERIGATQLKSYCEYYLAVHHDVLGSRKNSIPDPFMHQIEQRRRNLTEPGIPAETDEITHVGLESSQPSLLSPLAATMGHTLTPMFYGSIIFLVGGGNTHQYHPCRHLPLYNANTSVWGKIFTQGEAPQVLIYHTATPLEKTNPTSMFVYGGSNHRPNSTEIGGADFGWELDCELLYWKRISLQGDTPEPRTRHSMVAMYPEDRDFGRQRPHFVRAPSDLYVHDASLDVNLILFGGYSHASTTALADVKVLNCHRTSSGDLQCLWMQHSISGLAPSSRLAHTCEALPLSSSEGGFRMIGFGGVGATLLHNDVFSLRCGDISHLLWEEVQCTGTAPGQRYGHTMTAVPDKNQFIVHGGTTVVATLHDIFLLELEEATMHHGISFIWTAIQVAGNPQPCPRSRHSACSFGTGVLILGGSNEAFNQTADDAEDDSEIISSQHVDTEIYFLTPPEPSDGAEEQHLEWDWRRCTSKTFDPGCEPTIILEPSTYHTDLQSLVDRDDFSDLLIRTVHQDGSMDSEPLRAHKLFLVSRSEPLRAMLQNGMKESFTNTITLADITRSTFEALLTYIYTDTLQSHEDEVLDVLMVSNRFGLDGLVSLCEGLLQKVVDIENTSTLYSYADMFSLASLKTTVLSNILRNYEEVTHTEAWNTMSPELLNEIEEFRTTKIHMYMRDQPDHILLGGTPNEQHQKSSRQPLEESMAHAG